MSYRFRMRLQPPSILSTGHHLNETLQLELPEECRSIGLRARGDNPQPVGRLQITDHLQDANDRDEPALNAQTSHSAKLVADGKNIVIQSHYVEQRDERVHRRFSGKHSAT